MGIFAVEFPLNVYCIVTDMLLDLEECLIYCLLLYLTNFRFRGTLCCVLEILNIFYSIVHLIVHYLFCYCQLLLL